MMNLDTLYSLFILLFIFPLTIHIFYSAATGKEWAIILVCVCLALSYCDRVWDKRGDSIIYNFIKGIKEGE